MCGTPCITNFMKQHMPHVRQRKKTMTPTIDRTTPATEGADTAINVITDFDKVILWLDRPELPIEEELLKEHCTKLDVHPKLMRHNSRWKLKIEVFQPTSEFIRVLAAALGSNISAIVTYVEIACDFPAQSRKQAKQWRKRFLGAAQMKYQRQHVVRFKTTWYFGRRTDGKQRRENVLAVYADKPSKLNNAQPDAGLPPCLHIEGRALGSANLEKLGIGSFSDLAVFDHQRFWEEYINIFMLDKPTELGRHLADDCGEEVSTKPAALRKRSRAWIKRHTIKGNFVMHNALLANSGFSKRLGRVPFWEWAKATFR